MKRPVSAVVSSLATATLLASCTDAQHIAAPPAEDAAALSLSPLWDWDSVGIATGEPDPCMPPEPERADPTSAAARTGAVQPANDDCGNQPVDPPPTVTLNCPSSAGWMQYVQCTITANTSDFSVHNWRFDSSGGPQVVHRGTETTWSGPVVTSGTITVDYHIAGAGEQKSANITVSRRSGWSWSLRIGGRQGVPGEIDQCVQGRAGLTSGQSCSSGNPGALFTPVLPTHSGSYNARQVTGYGPNGGLWYVESAGVTMQLRTQINKEYRADGSVYPMNGNQQIVSACVSHFGGAFQQNTHRVNTACSWEPEFQGLVSFAWAHESRHLNAALNAARTPSNDLHLLLEPLVYKTASALEFAVSDKITGAHQRITVAANATHTGVWHPFEFWRYVNGGWNRAITQVQD